MNCETSTKTTKILTCDLQCICNMFKKIMLAFSLFLAKRYYKSNISKIHDAINIFPITNSRQYGVGLGRVQPLYRSTQFVWAKFLWPSAYTPALSLSLLGGETSPQDIQMGQHNKETRKAYKVEGIITMLLSKINSG